MPAHVACADPMCSRRLLPFLLLALTVALSGCEKAAPKVDLGPALLNPHTRAATVHGILSRNAETAQFEKDDLATFEREVDEIHVLPYPAVGKAAGYVVNLRDAITADGLVLSAHRHDRYARGRLHLGRERALVPLQDCRTFLVHPDGSIPPRTYFVGLDTAIVADLNGDGEPELAEQIPTTQRVDRENGDSATLKMDALKLTHPRDRFGAGPEFVFNPRETDGVPSEWWTWWAEDANADGIFAVHLGPVRAGQAQSLVTLEWNAAARAWEAKGILPGMPCRYMPRPAEEQIPTATRTLTAEEDLGDAIRNGLVTVPKGTPKPTEVSFFRPWYREIPVEQLSRPYKKQSLAGSSPESLFAAMTERRLLYQHLRPFTLKRLNLPPALVDHPQELARKIFVQVARLQNDPLAFDLLDGATPPETGDVMLYHFPTPGCFSPYEVHVTHLRCAPQASFVSISSVFAENTSRVAFMDYQPAFEFRRIALSDEEARALLLTAWWMRRIHLWPSNSLRDADLNQREYYDEDEAVLRVATGGVPWEARRYHRDQATRVIDSAIVLFREFLPELLGKRWEAESVGAFPMARKLSDAQQTRLRTRAKQVLEDFIAAPHAPEAARLALEAIEENQWEELRPVVEAVAKSIPPPTAAERRLAAIDQELDRWRREHGKDLAGERAASRRLSAREKLAQPSDPTLAIPGVTDAVALPGTPAARVYSKEELDRFAPLDALVAEKQRIRMSESESAFKELRMLSERAAKQLAAKDDPITLEQVARTTRWKIDPSIRRLSAIDPTRAAKVFDVRAREEWDDDPRMTAESLAILRGKAKQPDSSMEALALGLRPPNREDVPLLLNFQLGSGHIDFRMFQGVLRSLVPPAEPYRHDWPELDAALLKLHQANYHDVDSVSAALIRRKTLQDEERKMNIFPRSLLAFIAPDRFREPFKQHLRALLTDPEVNPDEIARAAWLCDLRELAPQLQPRATSRKEDLENWGAASRNHEVRWVLQLWDENDAATSAKLLISYAVGSAFHPDETPEAWQRLRAQLRPALAELTPTARVDVSAFLRWLQTHPIPRPLDEPQRVSSEQIITALASEL